ncbi:beta-N-acetylhexosaminidase [Halobacillus rhizosphaerae]|uniref:beta-N-acetylhexosaminidase n=1 Tax=Halobacillus rhizosphaerae TaxID=3064889 RepID=UPI00398A8F40
MKLFLQGDLDGLQPGIEELEKEYAFCISKQGLLIKIEQWKKERIEVSLTHQGGFIGFKEKIHFFRALGLLLEHAREKSTFHLCEHPQFILNGAMLDCSRNAVLKPDQIHRLMRKMAIMGLNLVMLYMEDTYELAAQPYFGYKRGRYTQEELLHIDEYADQFGIEVIPAIQTLAHLSNFLRWSSSQRFKDTDDILLAGSKDTSELINQMLLSATQPFRSKRVHIGMDEAHFLGRGEFLNQHGFSSAYSIMSSHLNQVYQMAKSLELRPMMWSDMYFRMASSTGSYYDDQAVIPQAVLNDIPKDMQYVYWDYYHEDEDFYQEFLQKHQQFGSDPIFAGGLWTWNGNSVHYQKAFRTTHPALMACKKAGVKEVIATLWGDDGAETDPFTSLLGLQLYAEHGYSLEVTDDKLSKRFRFCSGAEMSSFLQLGELDLPPGSGDSQLEPANPAKYLLWQDPLTGLFDHHLDDVSLNHYYKDLHQSLQISGAQAGEWKSLFQVPAALCEVLSIKSELGCRIRKFYREKDRTSLHSLMKDEFPLLLEKINHLKWAHYSQWMERNKPFGWEILDIRYGGLRSRVETAIHRLTQYLEGTLTALPELEEKSLDYGEPGAISPYLRCNQYKDIISANPI